LPDHEPETRNPADFIWFCSLNGTRRQIRRTFFDVRAASPARSTGAIRLENRTGPKGGEDHIGEWWLTARTTLSKAAGRGQNDLRARSNHFFFRAPPVKICR